MITALTDKEEKIKGFEAGTDDFLSKPVNKAELLTRVKSLLRIKYLHDELNQLNKTLEKRVKEQVEPKELLSMLNEYFSEMTQLIFNYGGTVGKFMGDGIMGFFGGS